MNKSLSRPPLFYTNLSQSEYPIIIERKGIRPFSFLINRANIEVPSDPLCHKFNYYFERILRVLLLTENDPVPGGIIVDTSTLSAVLYFGAGIGIIRTTILFLYMRAKGKEIPVPGFLRSSPSAPYSIGSNRLVFLS